MSGPVNITGPDKEGGFTFPVRLKPRGSCTRFEGVRDGVPVFRVAAPPVEGAANRALCELVAGLLSLPVGNVRIVGGERARNKRVRVQGISRERLEKLFASE
ncbi:MAG TPA: DUF167 domain-containing protein [Firmicutes bacterium]|nr:DUF167 domain-containing protein [Bacillota bacterium]